VNSFDRQGSLGLTSYLVNPAGVSTTDCVSRFVSLTTLPGGNACPITPGGNPVPELPAAPSGGFPFVPPGNGANGIFAIGWGIDNGMKTPYSNVVDFSITREMPDQFVFELAYVGRFGRRLLQEVDLAQPLNLVDPRSNTTYYQAATALVKMANANASEDSVQAIPYWENLFPGAAGPGGVSGYAPGIPVNPTATQNIYDLYYANGVNATYALQSLDAYCFPACSTLGPYAYWDDQFSSMFSRRTTGSSNYNALQAMLRRHAGSLEFDFNYTYSKSLDASTSTKTATGQPSPIVDKSSTPSRPTRSIPSPTSIPPISSTPTGSGIFQSVAASVGARVPAVSSMLLLAVGNTLAWPAGPAAIPLVSRRTLFPRIMSRTAGLYCWERLLAREHSSTATATQMFFNLVPPPARSVSPIRANPASETIFAAPAISAWI
jgi:hypothetical protein